jgi:hypothetical protein
VAFYQLKKDYFFAGSAAGAAGAAAGAPAAGCCAGAASAAGAAGLASSFLPQAAKETANKDAIKSDFFIFLSLNF